MKKNNRTPFIDTILSKYVSRLFLIIAMGSLSNFGNQLHTDPWKCGTPLLILQNNDSHKDMVERSTTIREN